MFNDLVLMNAGLRHCHLHSPEASTTPLRVCGATHCRGFRPSDSVVGDPNCSIMQRGRPRALCWRQMESNPENMGVPGLASTWTLAR